MTSMTTYFDRFVLSVSTALLLAALPVSAVMFVVPSI